MTLETRRIIRGADRQVLGDCTTLMTRIYSQNSAVLYKRLVKMVNTGYRLIAAYEGDTSCTKPVGLILLYFSDRMHCGKTLVVDSLVVEKSNNGIGKFLMKEIEDIADSEKCNAIQLDCSVSNTTAQKFYHNSNMEIRAFSFIKYLTPEQS